MKRLKVYLKIFGLCLLWTRRLCLGDFVIYQGKRWVLYQGVNDPLWDLGEPGGAGYLENIHRSKFRKERSIGNFIHDLRSGYRFYKGYWFDIWMSAERGDEQSIKTMRHMPR